MCCPISRDALAISANIADPSRRNSVMSSEVMRATNSDNSIAVEPGRKEVNCSSSSCESMYGNLVSLSYDVR